MRIAAGLLSLALLAACATTTREQVDLPEFKTWDARQAALAEISDWEFRGRIGVKAGDDGFNGKVRWIQQDEQFIATVGGPIGIGTVRIEGAGNKAVLTDKEGARTRLDDVETDLFYRYGWTLPVQSLRYWALGIPDPAAPAETSFDADGLLDSLSQREWTVKVERYRDGGGQPMPFRLTATSSNTKVRLVVDSWYFFK